MPSSVPEPPTACAHAGTPVDVYFATKMSWPPALVSAPSPKSTVPWNDPVTTTFPPPSTAIARPILTNVPPMLRDQTCAPLDAYFAAKMAPLPHASGPPPKSTLPEHMPVITTLPLPSAATP